MFRKMEVPEIKKTKNKSKLVKIYEKFLKNTCQLACELRSVLSIFAGIFHGSCLDFQNTPKY